MTNINLRIFYIFLLLIAFGLIVSIYFSIENQYYVVFEKLSLSGKDKSITIGRNSNIIYSGLPKDACVIEELDNDSIQVRMNQPVYLKINGNTQNLYFLDDSITGLNLGEDFLIKSKDLIENSNKWEDRNYFFVKELIDTVGLSVSQKERIFELKSLLHKDPPPPWKPFAKDTYQIILLDDLLSLNTKSEQLYFKNSFQFPQDKDLKLQFFDVKVQQVLKDGLLRTFISPYALRTPNRASHTLIRPLTGEEFGTWDIYFSNDYRLVLPEREVAEMIDNKEGAYVNMDCDIYSTTFNDIYIDPFSNWFKSKIARISRVKDSNSKLELTPYNLVDISNAGNNGDGKVVSQSFINEDVRIHVKSTKLTKYGFFFLPVYYLVFVNLLFLFTVFRYNPFKPFNNKLRGRLFLYNSETEVNVSDSGLRWGGYHLVLMLAFSILLLVKNLVSYKLSFTYPYYNYTYNTAFTITLVSPILLLLFWKNFYKINDWNARITEHFFDKNRKLKYGIILGLLTLFLLAIAVSPIYNFILQDIQRYEKLGMYETIVTSFNTKGGGFLKDKFLQVPALYIVLSVVLISTPLMINFLKIIYRWRKGLLVFLLGLGLIAISSYRIYYDKGYLINFFGIFTGVVLIIGRKFLLEMLSLEFILNNISWFASLMILALISVFFDNFHGAFTTPFIVVLLAILITSLANRIRRCNFKQLLQCSKHPKTWLERLCKNLSSSNTWRAVLVFLLGLGLIAIAFYRIYYDKGYLITFFGIFTGVVFIIVSKFISGYQDINNRWKFFWALIWGGGIGMLIWGASKYFTPEENFDSTFKIRISLFADFNTYYQKGLTRSEQDCEFFANMSHYSRNKFNWKPTEHGFLDSSIDIKNSISLPGYPIATNDLNPLVGLIGPAGVRGLIPLILIWGVLLFLPLGVLLENPQKQGYHKIYLSGIIRILASCVFVFTSAYMLLALLGYLPFTGRLIYGLGVDSLGESMETLLLFVLMGLKLQNK